MQRLASYADPQVKMWGESPSKHCAAVELLVLGSLCGEYEKIGAQEESKYRECVFLLDPEVLYFSFQAWCGVLAVGPATMAATTEELMPEAAGAADAVVFWFQVLSGVHLQYHYPKSLHSRRPP